MSAERMKTLLWSPFPAFAMLAGLELDLFTALGAQRRSAGELAGALGVKPHMLEQLLYALVDAELLALDGEQFANTPDTARYFVKGSPDFMHGFQDYCASFWMGAQNAAASIRAGRAVYSHDIGAMPEEEALRFLRSLIPLSRQAGQHLSRRYDFSRYERLADVGGGSGSLAIALLEAAPKLSAAVIELPAVVPHAEKLLREQGQAERIVALGADAVAGPLPGSYDVVVSRSLLQVLPKSACERVVRNIARVLSPGGDLYLVGAMLEDSRLAPPEIVRMNLFLMSAFEGGGAHTEAEHRGWLAGAGFEVRGIDRLPSGHSIIAARKRE